MMGVQIAGFERSVGPSPNLGDGKRLQTTF